MMTISYLVNLVVLGLMVPLLWAGAAGMDEAFGPDAPARRFLTCVYAAIWVVSLVGIVLMAVGRWDQALTIAIGLFSVQILYKLLTVWAVGFANPVVMTNLPIAILHAGTLSFILLRA